MYVCAGVAAEQGRAATEAAGGHPEHAAPAHGRVCPAAPHATGTHQQLLNQRFFRSLSGTVKRTRSQFRKDLHNFPTDPFTIEIKFHITNQNIAITL